MKKCSWPGSDSVMNVYHDTEWGVPVHDDTKLYEFLVLDAAQAGLSWRTVLYKREGYRKAFANFDYNKVAKFGEDDVARLMQDTAIIRNRLKIWSAIINAQKVLEVRKEFGSFDKYIWSFVGSRTIVNKWERVEDLPATSPESDAMSRDMKKRGFKFVGSTICYAFMQAAGLVNDHTVECFRYNQV